MSHTRSSRSSAWRQQIAADGLSRAAECYRRQPNYIVVTRRKKKLTLAELWRQKWRRITGMTCDFEDFLDPRERRAHIERLADWIEQRVKSGVGNRWPGIGSTKNETRGHGDAATPRQSEPRPSGSGFSRTVDADSENVDVQGAERAGAPHDLECPNREPAPSRSRLGFDVAAPFESTRNPELATRNLAAIGCTTDWLPDFPHWKCVSRELSVEALCEELGLTRQKLTRLLRELCGLSAGEFIDGLRLRLLPQLRIAARALWGRPGYQADLMASGHTPTGTWSLADKKSKFFQPQPEDWHELNAWRRDVRARAETLLAKLRELRRGGDDDTIESFGASPESFDLTGLALRLGLCSPQKLNEACVRVFGQRLAKIERTLAQEIVRYYIAAEDRALRELALKSDQAAYVARARYLYHGDDEQAPTEPFLDAWSAAEAFQKEWLDAMVKEFG